MIVFRQLFDPQSSTYTYLVGDAKSRKAVLIDPVFEQARRDDALLRELQLTLVATLETHIHADHVTGAWLQKQRHQSDHHGVGRQRRDRRRPLSRARRSRRFRRALARGARDAGTYPGCVSYVLDDESMAFTGDCLLIRGSGRTDFQEGDARTMYRSVKSQILALPPSCLLYPAHDYRGLTVTSVAEERAFNPRLGGDISEGDFVGYMMNLGLPHPKQMDIAVPANLKCGEPEQGKGPPRIRNGRR